MSILIKGLFGKDMPMPQEGYVDIRLHFKSGKLKRVTMPTGEDPFYATFDVEKLPPHGRLIDADKLKSRLIKDIDSPQVNGIYTNILHWISIQETVIEAEGSEA